MRLIRSSPASPARNLALDEALLRSGTPTFRLYSWDPPGYSLGFFQRFAEHAVPDGYELVRRPTGGGAIAHTGELTLSWVGAKERVDDVYATINNIVARALREGFGIEVTKGTGAPTAAPAGLCFDAHTCYDLCAGGGTSFGKIFGSAQRRARDRFLLHGSLVIGPNPISKGAISLAELLGRKVELTEVEEAVIAASGFDLTDCAPTAAEEADTDALMLDRYSNDTWTRRR